MHKKLSKEGQASPNEIEVTSEMIEAGVSVLRGRLHEELHHDFAEIVADVFVAMKERELDPALSS
ncbi:MAG: hypothetical protein KGZ69_13520 [Methylomonas sp.]|nr:hypothetical protein [Methylomonas sp.]